jgi:hypothetical protein
LNGIQLTDKSNVSDPIDVLIGSDYYWDIVGGEMIRGQSGPVAISSKFGWLLSGPATEEKGELKTTTNLIISGSSEGPFETTEDPIVNTLRKFWETESIGIKSSERCWESAFNESVRFNGERYEIDLPWKYEMPQLPSDFDLCVKRLRSLQRRLVSQPDLLTEYDGTVSSYKMVSSSKLPTVRNSIRTVTEFITYHITRLFGQITTQLSNVLYTTALQRQLIGRIL